MITGSAQMWSDLAALRTEPVITGRTVLVQAGGLVGVEVAAAAVVAGSGAAWVSTAA